MALKWSNFYSTKIKLEISGLFFLSWSEIKIHRKKSHLESPKGVYFSGNSERVRDSKSLKEPLLFLPSLFKTHTHLKHSDLH